MAHDTNVVCSQCGTRRFVYYQYIVEAADVDTFDDGNNAVVSDDAKWEITDVKYTEVRCENGHQYHEGVA